MKFIYIRGLVREKRHWDRFLPMMKSLFPQSQHFAVDIKGVGVRNKERSSATVDDMTKDIKRQIEQEFGEEGKDLVLVSVSMGGMIAMQFAYSYPHMIHSLVLMNTSIKGINPFYWRLKPGSLLTFIKLMVTPDPEKREEIILKMVSNNPQIRTELKPTWVQIQKENPVSKFNSFLQTFAAFRYSYPGVNIDPSRMLFLAGKKDLLCDVRCSMQLQQLFVGSSLKIHENAGHNIIDDETTWVGDQISDFIKSLNEKIN